jgi:multisubunit Na+/H+ antiporter MnhE subunit
MMVQLSFLSTSVWLPFTVYITVTKAAVAVGLAVAAVSAVLVMHCNYNSRYFVKVPIVVLYHCITEIVAAVAAVMLAEHCNCDSTSQDFSNCTKCS